MLILLVVKFQKLPNRKFIKNPVPFKIPVGKIVNFRRMWLNVVFGYQTDAAAISAEMKNA
jgi:hypothetical protein